MATPEEPSTATAKAHAAPATAVRVDVLAGDDAGNVFVAVPDAIDVPAERRADGWYVTTPGTITVTASIDGQSLVAQKQLFFDAPADNPAVTPMTAIDAARGDKPALDASATGAEPLAYAWYTSLGTLEHYRSPDAVLDATATGDGVVCVVVRDAQGGVAWDIIPASIHQL